MYSFSREETGHFLSRFVELCPTKYETLEAVLLREIDATDASCQRI